MYMNRMKMKEKRWYKNRGTVELGLASFSWKQIADESKCVKNKSDFIFISLLCNKS